MESGVIAVQAVASADVEGGRCMPLRTAAAAAAADAPLHVRHARRCRKCLPRLT